MGAHDWLIYAGENEGNPLLVMLDKQWGVGYADPGRQWAVMVEVTAERVDGNALPPQEDWPAFEALEAELVRELATDDDDWRYVVRVYGEGVVRYGFYAGRSGGVERRVARVMAEHEGLGEYKVTALADPKWAAYQGFFPEDSIGVAPSFRDSPEPGEAGPGGNPPPPRSFPRREEQPWRGEESQQHPDD